MKATLTLSLDVELINRLKQESNYSELVNEQMTTYYQAANSENKRILKQNLAEIKQKTKELNKKKREIEKKIIKVEEKEKSFYQTCPQCGGRLTLKGNCFKCGIRIERGQTNV